MLKSWGWGGVMAPKILETAQSPNFPFSFGIWSLDFGLGLGLSKCTIYVKIFKKYC